MPGETAAQSGPRITIQSRLQDLALLWPWAESIAEGFAAPPTTRFAMHLCLEEALSNIIRHGYSGEPGRPVTVQSESGPTELVFVIEDEAPPFNPLEDARQEEVSDPSAASEIPLGGQGIRFMRKFAGSLDYQRLPTGNVLTMSFPIEPMTPGDGG
jgi:serine/threonine-protein kinase RsbW